ncbi:MAG: DNA-processing protein DprA [Candidatus Cryptobacteroides sp.]|nr:DNA-processing protein DprA [Candidatus Cryptobacteroides sp.]
MIFESPEQLAAWSAVNRIFGFAPRTGAALIDHYGSPESLFDADRKELEYLLRHNAGYLDAIVPQTLEKERRELQALMDEGVRMLCIGDERYPSLLKECPDPPAMLYVRSLSPLESTFGNPKRISVVGTRDITSYGKEWCTRIVSAMSSCPACRPAIVSGLAIGTDITAHLAALDRGLPTIAVMATGIDAVYPFRHGRYAEMISSAPGSALVTDYPPETTPRAINFLRRNRIIAGLSDATILIESKIKGGGMMTCRIASSYDREVFALPGRIGDQCSAGCNELIRNGTAACISEVNSLLDSLGLRHGGKWEKDDIRMKTYTFYRDREGADPAERLSIVADIVGRNPDIRIEDIATAANMEYRDAANAVGMLECDGIVVTDLLRRCSVNPRFL